MPTYQYVCTNPGGKHEFEVVQSFSDPAVSSCPECAVPVRKVYGSVGVVFKGSGFYRTDSRTSESSTAAASSSSSKESSSSPAKESAPSSSSSKESSSGSTGTSSAAPSSSGAGSKAAN